MKVPPLSHQINNAEDDKHDANDKRDNAKPRWRGVCRRCWSRRHPAGHNDETGPPDAAKHKEDTQSDAAHYRIATTISATMVTMMHVFGYATDHEAIQSRTALAFAQMSAHTDVVSSLISWSP
jgi:hypothetical protein